MSNNQPSRTTGLNAGQFKRDVRSQLEQVVQSAHQATDLEAVSVFLDNLFASEYSSEAIIYASAIISTITSLKAQTDINAESTLEQTTQAILLATKDVLSSTEDLPSKNHFYKEAAWLGFGGLLTAAAVTKEFIAAIPSPVTSAILITTLVYSLVDFVSTAQEQHHSAHQTSAANRLLNRRGSPALKAILIASLASTPFIFASMDFSASMNLPALIGGVVTSLLVTGWAVNRIARDHSAISSARRLIRQKIGLLNALFSKFNEDMIEQTCIKCSDAIIPLPELYAKNQFILESLADQSTKPVDANKLKHDDTTGPKSTSDNALSKTRKSVHANGKRKRKHTKPPSKST